MPTFTPEYKKRSIEKAIALLGKNVELQKKSITVLLNDDLKKELNDITITQKNLRSQKKPSAITNYEKLQKQALMLFGRYESYDVKATIISNLIVDREAKKLEFADKAKMSINKARNYLVSEISKNPKLTYWLDRDVRLDAFDVGLDLEQLPYAITSRSEKKLVGIKYRFGLKSIKEIRLEVLGKALMLVENEIDEWYELNGVTRHLTEEQALSLKHKLASLNKRKDR